MSGEATHKERNRRYRERGGELLKLANCWKQRTYKAQEKMRECWANQQRLTAQLRHLHWELTCHDCTCLLLEGRPCAACWVRIQRLLVD